MQAGKKITADKNKEEGITPKFGVNKNGPKVGLEPLPGDVDTSQAFRSELGECGGGEIQVVERATCAAVYNLDSDGFALIACFDHLAANRVVVGVDPIVSRKAVVKIMGYSNNVIRIRVSETARAETSFEKGSLATEGSISASTSATARRRSSRSLSGGRGRRWWRSSSFGGGGRLRRWWGRGCSLSSRCRRGRCRRGSGLAGRRSTTNVDGSYGRSGYLG